jgi:hypothetical protein
VEKAVNAAEALVEARKAYAAQQARQAQIDSLARTQSAEH